MGGKTDSKPASNWIRGNCDFLFKILQTNQHFVQIRTIRYKYNLIDHSKADVDGKYVFLKPCRRPAYLRGTQQSYQGCCRRLQPKYFFATISCRQNRFSIESFLKNLWKDFSNKISWEKIGY